MVHRTENVPEEGCKRKPVTSLVPSVARTIFGEQLPIVCRYAELLADQGVLRGLIGPREVERLWERHLLNCAVVAELIEPYSTVLDVGSGAGLPGLPLAIARPDLRICLVEPMARRVAWLTEVITELGLSVEVVRGRAEEERVRTQLAGVDVVTARAVAPLARLTEWCLPLVRHDGWLLALKGANVGEEIERDAAAVARAGGDQPLIARCGVGLLETPATVAKIKQVDGPPGRRATSRRGQDRCPRERPSRRSEL